MNGEKKQPFLLESWLSHQKKISDEQESAIYFALNLIGDTKRLEKKIIEIEQGMDLESGIDRNEEIQLKIELTEVYLMGLRNAKQLIQKEVLIDGSYTERIKVILIKMAVPYAAKAAAFEFALKNGENKKIIEDTIREIEELTLNPPKDRERAMRPEATPGMYNRVYISTLRQILDRISTAK